MKDDDLNNYIYFFECDYGARSKEKAFVKSILKTFDKDYVTMVSATVNNNPYCLQFHIALNLQGDPIKFEKWLKNKYPEKSKRHNLFVKDAFQYNFFSLNEGMLDMLFSSEENALFLWPEKELLELNNPQFKCMKKNKSTVFISHSSKDKELIVNPLNAYLQANDIGTWIDSYEIDYGDNIYMKVNEGIQNSAIGIFILTENFFDKSSGWPMTEFSAFFMQLMKNNKKVLMVNAGLDHEKLDDMMKVYKYISLKDEQDFSEVSKAIKTALNKA